MSRITAQVGEKWRAVHISCSVKFVFEIFRALRPIIWTDWPDSNEATSFKNVVGDYDQLIAARSKKERADLWSGTVNRFYDVAIVEEQHE